MVVRITELCINHQQAFEVVADTQLFGHAHTAVQLHCVFTDHNAGFIFTIDDELKGLDMKADSEFGLALGVGALCKAAIGKLLYNVKNSASCPQCPNPQC